MQEVAGRLQVAVGGPGWTAQQAPVVPAVHAELVAGGGDLPDQARGALGLRAEQEEGGAHVVVGQYLQEPGCGFRGGAVVEGQRDMPGHRCSGQSWHEAASRCG